MNKIALLDADIIAYRCAASCEPTSFKPEREPANLAIERMDEMLWKILATVEADKYMCFLSGGDIFRKILYPEYKANRRDQRIPEYLNVCRDFLIQHWEGQVVAGYEADDAIAMNADVNTVIVSIDKDLKQIPGVHYHFVKDLIEEIDEDQADLLFWRLMLIGDRADNIKGVPGIGEVKSLKLLEELTPEERAAKVLDLYDSVDRFNLNFRLFRLLRSEDEYNELIEEIHINPKQESKGKATTEHGEERNP